MSNTNPNESRVWVPKQELDTLFEGCEKKSYFAELIIRDFYENSYGVSKYSKLLLKELFCLVETNVPYYRELVESQRMIRDNREGYFLTQGDLLSLTTMAVSLKKISSELEECNLVLDIQ